MMPVTILHHIFLFTNTLEKPVLSFYQENIAFYMLNKMIGIYKEL